MHKLPATPHNRTTTSTQGILNDRFSRVARSSSNPFALLGMLAVTLDPESPASNLFLTLSIAVLASEPPVPLMADMARLAVSSTAWLNVALPLNRFDAVSDIEADMLPFHRGSNQFAEKSNSEKTRTNNSMLQYTQGRWSM